jgi:hypothetical protein
MLPTENTPDNRSATGRSFARQNSRPVRRVGLRLEELESRLTPSNSSILLPAFYHDLLNRVPDAGSAGYGAQLDAGVRASLVAYEIETAASNEYRLDLVQSYYVRFLHRQGSVQELQGYAGLLAASATDEQVEAKFVGSQEYYQLHGSTNMGWLNAVYQDLLARPDTEGAHLNEVNSGAPRELVALYDILSSSEFTGDQVSAYYQKHLGRSGQGDPGVSSFAGALQARQVTDEVIIAELLGSQEYYNKAAGPQNFPNNVNVPGLPPPTGTIINVATASQLQTAVANLQSAQTILIAPGTYVLTNTLYVPQGLTNVAIRGATGKAADVVVKGDATLDAASPYSGSAIWGPGSGITGTIPFGIWLGNVQGVTIADLTLQNYVDDAIILNAGVQAPLIHDVVMLDTGEQLLKSNPNGSGGGVNNGIVEYCMIGYTTAAPNNYTNGVDVHTGQNWIIRNNVFKNLLTTNPLTTTGPGALAGPAVLIWNHSVNCTTVANTFINCQREIAYGLSDPSSITNDNSGGLIANNFIYRSGSQHGDVAIGVWNSPNTEVAYNSVILNGDFGNAIEYRFSTTTGVKLLYNLTDAAITSRDGATGTVTGNVTNAQLSWFVNESIGDLHLTGAATGAIGHGVFLAEVPTDYSGRSRPSGSPTDVGAAQF